MKFSLAILFILLTFAGGCRSKIESEVQLFQGDLSAESVDPRFSKVIVFNDSSFVLFGMDESKGISVKIDGKPIAKLAPGQYVQALVPKGVCEVKLVHWDLRRFSSQQRIELLAQKSFLRVRATSEANEAEVVSELPPDFEKRFRPIK